MTMPQQPNHLPNHLIERAAALLHVGRSPKLHDASAEPASEAASEALQPPLLAPLLPTQGVASFAPQPAESETPASADPTVPPMPPVASSRAPPIPLPVATRPALPRPMAEAPLDPSAALPVVALDAMERAGLVVARAARTRISEEYRIVIGRVLRAMRDEPDGPGLYNVVMVTSARPNEGKSFTALNLAGSIVQHSTEKVLLVDLDAKLHPMSSMLGASGRPGFHDLVVNPALRLEDVILDTAVGNLTFLPVGSRLHGSTEIASVRPITPIITRLSRRFPKHLIILDAPPCLSTSDPHTIAPLVGQVVMVVEAERTQRSEVEAAIELVRTCPTITMLLNKVKLTTSHTFGAYDYYGSYS
jgi:protein-tyrosine kinase